MVDLRWTPFITLLHRECARFLKVAVQTVITPFVSSALYLMIFGVSLGSRIEINNGINYLAFLIPGLVMMACLNNAFQNTSSSIISSKFSGDLEDLKVAPLNSTQIITALTLAALARGLIVGGITFLVGQIFYYSVYGAFLPVAHTAFLITFLTIGGLSFANLGVMVAFWARTFDQLSAVTGFILLPLIYLGGVFFSVEHLPNFWRQVSLYNPLLYMINGVRFGLLGQSDVNPQTSLIVSLVGFMVTWILAMRSLKTGSYHRW